MRTVINDAEYADVIALAAHAVHEIPGVLGKCMSLSILLEISFDRVSVYSLFCVSIFTQTYIYIYIYISFYFFLGLKKEKTVFNNKELCSAEMAKAIISIQVLMQCLSFLGKERYLFGTGWRKVHRRHFHY